MSSRRGRTGPVVGFCTPEIVAKQLQLVEKLTQLRTASRKGNWSCPDSCWRMGNGAPEHRERGHSHRVRDDGAPRPRGAPHLLKGSSGYHSTIPPVPTHIVYEHAQGTATARPVHFIATFRLVNRRQPLQSSAVVSDNQQLRILC
eukprot:361982-Chlamydomonas_euryale.AAC.5